MKSLRDLPLLRRYWRWIPAGAVLGVVLIAGARLIDLSMRQHAADARQAARILVARHERAIEAQLQKLAERAAHAPDSASDPAPGSTPGSQPDSAPDSVDQLLISSDGTLLQASEGQNRDPATVQGIVNEWAAVDARRASASRGILGPVRLGSQWILAARAPIALADADGGGRQMAWSVAYQSLDDLLAEARLGEITRAGYDFELSQMEPATRQPRIFISSRPMPLAEPIAASIDWPSGMAKGSAASGLTLAVRPRAGWYPLVSLSAGIGLLLAIAWLLALLVYDVTRHSRDLKTTLANERRRLREVNHRLVGEIERRQSLQQSLVHARHHDAFTGLPNRLYFMDQLDRALREARTRPGLRFAALLIEIDRFKLINDTLGQTAGDELMLQVARRFENTALPVKSVLSRWSGDQFAVLLLDVQTRARAVDIARMLQTALREPFDLRRLRVSAAARMGVACIDSGLQRAEEVLREADIALSAAKTPEHSDVIAFEPGMGGDVVSLVRFEADLQLALERRQLKLLFQPIVELRTRRIVGAEALLRWQHPTEGLLKPDKFLAIAEETGPMVPITRWIVESVCGTMDEWRRLLLRPAELFVSVNLSAAALRDSGFGEYVIGVMRQTRTPPAALRFELTEGGLAGDTGAARETLRYLHGRGIRLTLDDFGTGHSSLNFLQRFPFDDLKIDHPFLDAGAAEGPNSGIIRAILQMAWSLGIKPIAEKVETPEALEALTHMGCELGQGFLLGEPVDAERILDRLMNQELGGSATVMAEPLVASNTGNEAEDSPTLVLPASAVKGGRSP